MQIEVTKIDKAQRWALKIYWSGKEFITNRYKSKHSATISIARILRHAEKRTVQENNSVYVRSTNHQKILNHEFDNAEEAEKFKLELVESATT